MRPTLHCNLQSGASILSTITYSSICGLSESREWQPTESSASTDHLRSNTHHFPLNVITAQLFPSLSVSFSTFVENEMALIIPSPNFSFNIALYAKP